MTTPKTIPGRILVIFYGFLGCSGAILFFNLFLERIITFLAYILRSLHERELRRRGFDGRRDSQLSFDDNLDEWKPSVYWVMLYLLVATILIAVTASTVYSPMEGWSYFDCLYFCFVAFSTIGFGDLVTSQEKEYAQVGWYRMANFVFIVCGCCCIYSLFNVTSIIIKQFLNRLMKLFDCSCACNRKPPSRPALAARGRRNAITPDHLRHQARGKMADSSDVDSTYDSDGDRRNSGEMISMQEFLRANKVSLAVMQKELYESAQRGQAIILPSRIAAYENSFQPGAVGPLAIVTKKLGDDDT